MPSEIRHVVFRSHEVARAVSEYRERTGIPMPNGSPSECTIESSGPGQDVKFTMVFAAPQGCAEHKQVKVTASGPELAAAMILYCRNVQIPLPAAAAKSLAQFGENLCLVITQNARGGKLPQLAGR